jgi:hypothetical protein
MDEFQPRYDANGVFVGVTLHATKYSAGHPVADLWLDRERLRNGLKIVEHNRVFFPDSFAGRLLEGLSVDEAQASDAEGMFP